MLREAVGGWLCRVVRGEARMSVGEVAGGLRGDAGRACVAGVGAFVVWGAGCVCAGCVGCAGSVGCVGCAGWEAGMSFVCVDDVVNFVGSFLSDVGKGGFCSGGVSATSSVSKMNGVFVLVSLFVMVNDRALILCFESWKKGRLG